MSNVLKIDCIDLQMGLFQMVFLFLFLLQIWKEINKNITSN